MGNTRFSSMVDFKIASDCLDSSSSSSSSSCLPPAMPITVVWWLLELASHCLDSWQGGLLPPHPRGACQRLPGQLAEVAFSSRGRVLLCSVTVAIANASNGESCNN